MQSSVPALTALAWFWVSMMPLAKASAIPPTCLTPPASGRAKWWQVQTRCPALRKCLRTKACASRSCGRSQCRANRSTGRTMPAGSASRTTWAYLDGSSASRVFAASMSIQRTIQSANGFSGIPATRLRGRRCPCWHGNGRGRYSPRCSAKTPTWSCLASGFSP